MQVLDRHHDRLLARDRLDEPACRPGDLAGRAAAALEADRLDEQAGDGIGVLEPGEEGSKLRARRPADASRRPARSASERAASSTSPSSAR